MGITISRLLRRPALLDRSTVGHLGSRLVLRRFRHQGCRAAVGGTSHVPSMKVVGVNLTAEDRDPSSVFPSPIQNLAKLRILETKMCPSFFQFLAVQRGLRVLELKEIEIDGDVGEGSRLSFLKELPNLETLVIDDCHQLTSTGGLHVLLEMAKLKRLVLGIEALAQLSDEFCSSCSIDLSLILYGPRCVNDHLKLKTIPGLTCVKFVDFWTLEFPLWIRDIPRLESLSFVNGTVKGGQTVYDVILPSNLKHFSCLSCRVDRRILDTILFIGRKHDIQELELGLPCFRQDIAISSFQNLHVLKISAKEFDGEILQHLVANKDLHVIELSGCQHLTKQHLVVFDVLQSLEKISISCSHISHDGCEQLAALHSIRCLEFHCCWGIDLNEIQRARSLRRLVVDKCMCLCRNLNEFLESLFVQGLDTFHIEESQPDSDQ